MFPISFSTLGCPAYDVGQVIALAKAGGYRGVEIRHLAGTVELASRLELAPAEIASTRARFTDAGLAVVGIGSSVRMTSLDPAVRAAQLQAAVLNARIAVGLGAPFVRVFGGPLPKDQDPERSKDAIAQGLADVARVMREEGAQALLETHDDFSTTPAILDLYARGAGPHLGLLWDTFHSWRHGETAQHTWAALGNRIGHVHVKDAHFRSAADFDLCLTGVGDVPLASFFAVLRDASYRGFISLEWEKAWHPTIEEPDVAMPQFGRWMREGGWA